MTNSYKVVLTRLVSAHKSERAARLVLKKVRLRKGEVAVLIKDGAKK